MHQGVLVLEGIVLVGILVGVILHEIDDRFRDHEGHVILHDQHAPELVAHGSILLIGILAEGYILIFRLLTAVIAAQLHLGKRGGNAHHQRKEQSRKTLHWKNQRLSVKVFPLYHKG